MDLLVTVTHYHEPQQWFIVGTSKIVGAQHEENTAKIPYITMWQY